MTEPRKTITQTPAAGAESALTESPLTWPDGTPQLDLGPIEARVAKSGHSRQQAVVDRRALVREVNWLRRGGKTLGDVYTAVLAERNVALAEVERLQTELEIAEKDLRTLTEV